MVKYVVIAALALIGCAKNYRVCVVAENGVGCMNHGLSKGDADVVGRAVGELGYQVLVRKGKGYKIREEEAPQPEAPRTGNEKI